jgi:site-specific recombinase XerD
MNEVLQTLDLGRWDELQQAIDDYLGHCRAKNLTRESINTYARTLLAFWEYQKQCGLSVALGDIRPKDIENYIQWMFTRVTKTGSPPKPATVHREFRGLRSFFNWLADNDIIVRSPMLKLKGPRIVLDPPAVLTREDILRLLALCQGDDFYSRRDMAILVVLIDTGVRRDELVSMRLDGLDLAGRTVWVLGKGKIRRQVPLGDT